MVTERPCSSASVEHVVRILRHQIEEEGFAIPIEPSPASTSGYTVNMARLPLRLLGLCLLVVAITVPGCQALFPREGAEAARPITPELIRDGWDRPSGAGN